MIGRTNSTFGGAISLPDGSTATANDVQTWLKCAGINKSYTTVNQVIADTNTLFLLMSDENAMKYLARSTDFADTICADETSMTYLGQSAYVDSTILNSDIWKQSIKASQYWTLVYASKTVTVYGSAYETITIEGYYGSFTTNANGSVNHVVPIDTIVLTGSVSGQSFNRTVTKDTTDVYVMPEGALYWYGWNAESFKFYTGTPEYSSVEQCAPYTNYYHRGYGCIKGSTRAQYDMLYVDRLISRGNYTKICLIVKNVIPKYSGSNSNNLNLKAWKNDGSDFGVTYANTQIIVDSSFKIDISNIVTCDISQVSEQFYACIFGKGVTADIYALWLE